MPSLCTFFLPASLFGVTTYAAFCTCHPLFLLPSVFLPFQLLSPCLPPLLFLFLPTLLACLPFPAFPTFTLSRPSCLSSSLPSCPYHHYNTSVLLHVSLLLCVSVTVLLCVVVLVPHAHRQTASADSVPPLARARTFGAVPPLSASLSLSLKQGKRKKKKKKKKGCCREGGLTLQFPSAAGVSFEHCCGGQQLHIKDITMPWLRQHMPAFGKATKQEQQTDRLVFRPVLTNTPVPQEEEENSHAACVIGTL